MSFSERDLSFPWWTFNSPFRLSISFFKAAAKKPFNTLLQNQKRRNKVSKVSETRRSNWDYVWQEYQWGHAGFVCIGSCTLPPHGLHRGLATSFSTLKESEDHIFWILCPGNNVVPASVLLGRHNLSWTNDFKHVKEKTHICVHIDHVSRMYTSALLGGIHSNIK